MRILVTGAAGFLGGHLCAELRKGGHEVIPVDRDQADLRKPRAMAWILLNERPDVVVHLAAKVGRLFGEDDFHATITDNATMTALTAQACSDFGVRMVYASTSEVYGDRGPRDCREEHLYASDITGTMFSPHNLYGLSKRWGEEAARLYAPDGLTIWRISMPYGPGLPAGRGRAAIINMLYQALHGQPIPVHRGAERSWCWVGDTVRAMRLTIEESGGGVYNIGRDDQPTPMRTVAEIACDLTNASHDLIQEVNPPARQTVVKRLSTDKIRSLGWEPEVDLCEGMARTLEWVMLQPAPLKVAA